MINRAKLAWRDISIRTKLMIGLMFMAISIIISNLTMYTEVNTMVNRLGKVYSSNVNINGVEESLDEMQQYLYRYLEIRDYNSLQEYYQAEEKYRDLYGNLNGEVTNNTSLILEKNIRNMSDTFVGYSDSAITARRGNDVERYKNFYNQAMSVYRYIKTDLYKLNSMSFSYNTGTFGMLQKSLFYLEVYCIVAVVIVTLFGIFIMTQIIRDVLNPLRSLANAAQKIGTGQLDVKTEETESKDEVGVVTHTFNNMVVSLNDYVDKVKESAEKERQMQEKELMMQNHLKEAELRFLQAQINPHFLYNSLNAGMQLAVMSDDEDTAVFLEKMSDLFRYNVKKGNEDATLREEIEMTDNFVYIMNVRFAGDIHFTREVDEALLDIQMPAIIIQPIVENAISHGIRDMVDGGRIHLRVWQEDDWVMVSVKDNGKGMSQEEIQGVLTKKNVSHEEHTGIGIDNVISRLSIYFDKENLVEMNSLGRNMGTEVIVRLPINTERFENV